MKGIAFAFFLTAAICVTLGMLWGIQKSATDDHTLGGAHAHLNLVGWVTMGLFGLYYTAVPAAAEKMLAKIHYALALLGVVLMVPGIVLAITEKGPTFAIIGSFLTLASMLVFVFTVLTNRKAA